MTAAISIVIPSFNSKSLLKRGLHSLEQQSVDTSLFEVIVIDDGSSDDTMTMLEEFKKTTTLSLQAYHIQNSGPATARNKGVSYAQAEWIAFLDADVIAHPLWLQRALNLIQLYPESAGFEGRTLVSDRHLLTPFTHQTENYHGGRFPTCNLILRKIFCHFNTDYRIPFREDTDLAFCVLESGFSIPFDPELQVFHPPLSPNYLRPIKLAKRYFYDGLLRARFPFRYQRNLDAHKILGMQVSHLKRRIYGLFILMQIWLLGNAFVLGFSGMQGKLCLFSYITLYVLCCYMMVRPTQPESRKGKDTLMVMVIINFLPWVMYYQYFSGYWKFRHIAPFSSSQWMTEIGITSRKSHQDIVLISTADWDHPFWTNKQHIASRLAKRGNRVLYVESLGLRQLTTSYRDLHRIYLRLRRSLMGVRELQPLVYVWSPIVLPFHRFAFVRKLNWWFLSTCIKHFCKILHFKNTILWSYNPIITPITELIPFSATIYHCVDELREAPGMPAETLAIHEKAFCQKVNIIFTTSLNLYKSRLELNSHTYYLPNPCDFEHFNQATGKISISSELTAIPEPRLGFVGALSHYKIDAELLKHLARNHPDWHIVLIGQIGEGEPGARFDELFRWPNIHYLGPKRYQELPNFMKGFQVALLPCPINGYTINMFPLKFFEYLAAGVPVVSTALPALQDFRQNCYWCETTEEFDLAISLAIEDSRGQTNKIKEGIELAKQNTWNKRVESMLKIMDENLNLAPPATDKSSILKSGSPEQIHLN